MLEDFGVRIVIAGVVHKALVDESDQRGFEPPGGGAPQIHRQVLATVKTAHYPDVQPESLVQLGPAGSEVEHRVAIVELLGDGALTQLTLRLGNG